MAQAYLFVHLREKTTPDATEGTTQNNTKATIKKIQ